MLETSLTALAVQWVVSRGLKRTKLPEMVWEIDSIEGPTKH